MSIGLGSDIFVGVRAGVRIDGGGTWFWLRDTFESAAEPGFASPRAAESGPGKLVRYADTGDNVSIADDMLTVAAVTGDLDPAYYWTRADDGGFARANGLALIAYHHDGVWIGWSNTATLTTAAMLYGAKGRDAYAAGTAWTEALPIGDAAHIIVLAATGAQHFVRVGSDEYLAFTYPAGSDATLYPALLGKVTSCESVYVYSVTPAVPLVNIATPTAGTQFSHPTSEYLIEFDVDGMGGSEPSNIVLHRQDASNYLYIEVAANGQLSLRKVEADVDALVARMSDTADVISGSRVLVQMRPDAIFTTTNGSGTTFKSWVDGKLRASTSAAPFGSATAGEIGEVAAAIPLSNLRIWSMTT